MAKKLKYPLAMPHDAKEEIKHKKAKFKNISPKEFLDETEKMRLDAGDETIIDAFKKHIMRGHHLGPLKLYKNDIQDGRHRAEASKELGIDKVPVLDFRDVEDREERASGGSVYSNHLPPKLPGTEEDPEAAFRRLISWSFAVAPLFGRRGHAAGGSVRPEMGDGGIISKALNVIRAYHGSPHKFDAFDIGKIGTGEGAQAYGHGLYFAGNEDVARGYRDRLAGNSSRALAYNGEELPVGSTRDLIKYFKNKGHDDLASVLGAQYVIDDSFRKSLNLTSDSPSAVDARNLISNLSQAPTKGHMYEVNLHADPEHLLDWDKPFASADDVERFAAKFDSVAPGIRKKIDDWGYSRQQSGLPMPDGNDIMREVFGGVDGSRGREASRIMQQAGIPGIKYLDQGSRGAGEGSHNYVMFSHDPVEILRRYEKGGRIGYANTGAVDDIDAAIRAANEVSQRQGMTHEVGQSAVPREERETHYRVPIAGYEIPLGKSPEPLATIKETAAGMLPYAFGPLGRAVAAADLVEGIREKDPVKAGFALTNSPWSVGPKALGALAMTQIAKPNEAEAGPIDRALGVARRIVSQAGEHGEFLPKSSRERDPRLWHDISKTVLSRPLGEMSAEHEIVGGMPERKIIRPEDLEGSALIPALGDRTSGGALLKKINEQSLEDPTVMQAGHSFMFRDAAMGPDKAAWASDPNIIKMLSNKARAAVEAGYDPHLIYTAMGSRSGDYSHHMTDTLLNMFKNAKVSKKDIQEFDRQMRENTKNKWKGYSDFPGISSPELEKYLYETGPAKSRTKLAELMGMGQFQKAGFPDVGAARFGITDPELLHALDLSAGRSIARLDPTGKIIKDPAIPHKTYKHQLGAHPEGGYVGGFEHDVPFEVMNKEFIDKLLAEDAEKYSNPSQLAYTYRMNAPTVYATPEWVDRVSSWLEKKKRGLIP